MGVKGVLRDEGSRGRTGLVGMRQLILSMGLVWMEVRIFAQVRGYILTIYVLNIVVCAL
jgi:hypothetical protein